MPDRSSNIPSYVFYGTIMSEFIRISRTTLLFMDFLPKAKKLTQRMVTQGGNETKVWMQVRRAINRHPDPFRKFAMSTQQIMQHISTNP